MRQIGDGFERVNLHHLNQDVAGSLAEVFGSTHRALPPRPSWRVLYPDAAAAFCREVAAYWRWRASQLGEN